MNELQKQEVYKRVNKELQNIKPSQLCSTLWDKGHAHTMGYGNGEENMEIYKMVQEDMADSNEFMDLYYEWHSICCDENVTGKNEGFNEHLEEYYPNIDEDEKWNIAHEWVDSDGFTYGAYSCYITELVEESLEEIKEEQFEKDYEVYKNKLKTIKGLEIDNSIIYNDYGYESINGLYLYTYEDDEDTPNIEFYIEWTLETGWSYYDCVSKKDLNNIDEVVSYIKNNIKNIKKVA